VADPVNFLDPDGTAAAVIIGGAAAAGAAAAAITWLISKPKNKDIIVVPSWPEPECRKFDPGENKARGCMELCTSALRRILGSKGALAACFAICSYTLFPR